MTHTEEDVKRFYSLYDEVFEKLYDPEGARENKFKGQTRFPLLLKKPFYTYSTLKEDDFIYFNIPTTEANDSSSFVVVAEPGAQKTTAIMKRLIYYFWCAGFNVGVLDTKGTQGWACVSSPTFYSGLHPDETPGSMPVFAGSPEYVVRLLSPKQKSRIRTISLPLKKFINRELLKTLGFSPGAVLKLSEFFRKGMSPQDVLKLVRKSPKQFDHNTRRNLQDRLTNLVDEGFFEDGDELDIAGLWDEHIPFAVGLGGQDERNTCAYADVILKTCKEYQDRKHVEGDARPCVIFIDDTQTIAGRHLDRQKRSSVQTVENGLALWRESGITLMTATQGFTYLTEEVYGASKFRIIGSCADVQQLGRYVTNKRIIDMVLSIDYRPDEYVSEFVVIFPSKQKAVRGYTMPPPLTRSYRG